MSRPVENGGRGDRAPMESLGPSTQERLRQSYFQANPDLALTELDALQPSVRQALNMEDAPSDTYGVLYSRSNTNFNLRLITKDTALLFLTLQDPKTLPRYVLLEAAADDWNDLAKLILDGVLEIAGSDFPVGTAPVWLSGVAAQRFLLGVADACHRNDGKEQGGNLGIEALRYAQELPLLSVEEVALRLYRYNAIPKSPRWQRKLASREMVAKFLGLNGGNGKSEHGIWRYQAPTGHEVWHYLHNSLHEPQKSGRHYKLYISPTCDLTPDALHVALRVLPEANPIALKVGATCDDILRPDKMVVYFNTMSSLSEAVAALHEALQGVSAQGVPFTASFSEDALDGLLSWGMDPSSSSLADNRAGSWRAWITQRLAVLLNFARTGNAGVHGGEPWEFALERLSLDGIDTRTWTPVQNFWARDPFMT